MSEEILAYIPSPPQGVWHLGPLPIRAYALWIVAGIVVAILLTQRRYQARGGDGELVYDASIVVIICGIIGGRAYHVMTDYNKYFCQGCDPKRVFAILDGGLGIPGAVALGTLGVFVLLRSRGIPFGPFADAAAPGVILAQGIGRIGNYFNQELYGRATTVPWGLEIYLRTDAEGRVAPLTGTSTGQVLEVVHPTFLYEMLWNFAIAGLLIWLDRKFQLGFGKVFALYVSGYSLGRSWVELMRSDAATHIMGLRVNTITFAVLFFVGLVLVIRLPKGRRTPDQVAGVRKQV